MELSRVLVVLLAWREGRKRMGAGVAWWGGVHDGVSLEIRRVCLVRYLSPIARIW